MEDRLTCKVLTTGSYFFVCTCDGKVCSSSSRQFQEAENDQTWRGSGVKGVERKTGEGGRGCEALQATDERSVTPTQTLSPSPHLQHGRQSGRQAKVRLADKHRAAFAKLNCPCDPRLTNVCPSRMRERTRSASFRWL